MFNKKRIVVAVVFILFMFCFITFAGGTPQNQAIATRNVTFIDSYNNAEVSAQQVLVGEDAEVPENPRHDNLVFVGWYLESDRDVRVENFTNITDNITVVALYGADLNGNGIVDDDDETYTVRFVDSTDNAVIATREVLVGMSAVPPTAPTHAGLTFTGWDASYVNVRRNTTVNAIYRETASTPQEVVTHTVSFIDTIADAVFATVEVEDGLTVNVPTAPTHEGYVFVRWEGDLDNITEDTEIRGIYAVDSNNNGEADDTEDKYTVSYRSLIAGTQNEAPAYDNSFLTTEEYTVLDNTFTLARHAFLGWTTDESLASAVADLKPEGLVRPGSTHRITDANVIYYAVWAKDENEDGVPDYESGQKFEVSVTYGYGESAVTETTTVLKGTTFDSVLPEMDVVDPTDEDDYAFSKWVTVEGETETDLTDVTAEITGDVTIKAIYSEDKNHNGIPDTDPSEKHYDVTFKTDDKYANLLGDDDSSSYTVSIVEGAKLKGNVPAIKELTDDKIAFYRWTIYDGLKDRELTTLELEDIIVTSDMEFTAIFSKDNNDNGISDDDEQSYELTIQYKNSVTGDKMFEDKKLSLVDGEDYRVESPVPQKGKYTITPEVVTGHFVKENDGDVITVTYTPNKDENGNGIDDSADRRFTVTFMDYDDTILNIQAVLVGLDAKAPIPTTEYTKDGYTYTFDGTWNKDFTNVQENITNVKPNYTKVATEYTVTYIVDGRTISTEKVAFDSKLTNVPKPTKEGYTLGSWKLDGNEYDITSDYTYEKDITLTNEFTANEYKVTYKVEGEEDIEKTVKYDSVLKHISSPTKTGYTFAGWYTQEDEKVEDNEVYTTASDITLTAKFVINKYDVTVSVPNGTVDNTKLEVEYKGSTEFAVTPNEFYTLDEATVECSNASGTLDTKTGVLSVTDVTSDAVCTVKLESDSDNNGTADAYEAAVKLTVKNATDATTETTKKIKVGDATTVSFDNIVPSSGIYSLDRYTVSKGDEANITLQGDAYVISNVTEAKVYEYVIELSRPSVTLSVHTDKTYPITNRTVDYEGMKLVFTVADFRKDNGQKVYPGYTVNHATLSCDAAEATTYLTAKDGSVDVHIENVSDDTVCVLHLERDADDDGIADEYARNVAVQYPSIVQGQIVDKEDEYKKSEGDVLDAKIFTKKADAYETEDAKYTFSHWTLNGSVVSTEEMSEGITVGNSDMVFKAEYTKVDKHTMTVKYVDSKGNAFKDLVEQTKDGLIAGDTVTIVIPTYENYTARVSVSNGANITDIIADETTVTMPDADVEVTVMFEAGRDLNDNGIDDNEEKLTVRFYDDVNGKLIGEAQKVLYGDSATAPANPTKASTAEFDYAFASWDKSYTNVTTDLDVHATYNATKRKYSVVIKGRDNNNIEIVLDTKTEVEYGTQLTLPTVPANIDLTQQKTTISFSGWKANNTASGIITQTDSEYILTVTGNVTVTAEYNTVETAGVVLYLLPENYIRQEHYTEDSRKVFQYLDSNMNFKTHTGSGEPTDAKRISFIDTTGKLKAIVDKKQDVVTEFTPAEIRQFLSKDSLAIIDDPRVQADVYVLKYYVNDGWHLDGQRNPEKVAAYRKDDYGFTIESEHEIVNVTYRNKELVVQNGVYRFIDYTIFGTNHYVDITDIKSRRPITITYKDNQGVERTKDVYWS